jgi:hypothetical protein
LPGSKGCAVRRRPPALTSPVGSLADYLPSPHLGALDENGRQRFHQDLAAALCGGHTTLSRLFHWATAGRWKLDDRDRLRVLMEAGPLADPFLSVVANVY